MKRLFISLLLLLAPLALIRGKEGTKDLVSLEKELKTLKDNIKLREDRSTAEIQEKVANARREMLEKQYKEHRKNLDLRESLSDREEYLKKISLEIIKDIAYDPSNKNIISNILCMDSVETGND